MKLRLFFSALLVLTLFSCDKNEDNDLIGIWDLTKITGGLAGVDCDYSSGDVKWTFGETTLITENNLNGSHICNSVAVSASYTYSVLESDGNQYLLLNGQETGQLTFEGDILTIDQNKFSTGAGADGFVYTLERN